MLYYTKLRAWLAKQNKNSNVFYATAFISQDTFDKCKQAGAPLKDGTNVKVGDIVICSDMARDFKNPCELGKVVKVCRSQKLVGTKGKEHPDGPVGHVYVLSYKRQKLGRKKLECKQACYLRITLSRTYKHITLHCHLRIVIQVAKDGGNGVR